MSGHGLSARVGAVEGWSGVQVGVAEGSENIGDHLLQSVKIEKQAVGIEVVAGDGRGYTPVVAVDGFALAGDEQGMGRAELGLDADFVDWRFAHEATIADNRCRMRTVLEEEVTNGEPLPYAMYTRGSRLLAHAGTVLTGEMLTALAAAGDFQTLGLCFDVRDIRMRAKDQVGVDTAVLRGGGSLKLTAEAAAAADGRRLMRVRADLRRRGGEVVRLAKDRWDHLPLQVEVGADPVLVNRHADRVEGAGVAAETSLRERRAVGVGLLRAELNRLLGGEQVALDPLAEIADDLIDALVHDAARYSIVALGLPRPVDSLPDHSYSTGGVAIAIAAQLGWSRTDVRMVGVAGFLCDAGIGLVPHALRQAARPLTDIELNAVRRHPEYSVALARRVGGFPERAALAVHQHHERLDGSGYPGAVKAGQIHDYARVLAIADAFAGMTSPRTHRPAMTPAAAMSEIAHVAAGGGFDKVAARALLDALGMYPAGSLVKLSSGHIASVGASGPQGAADRPVVRVMATRGREIDLALVGRDELRVVDAVSA